LGITTTSNMMFAGKRINSTEGNCYSTMLGAGSQRTTFKLIIRV
jgi:hypothetical protein